MIERKPTNDRKPTKVDRHLSLATWIVGWSILAVSAAFGVDVYCQLAGRVRFDPPDYFVHLVTMAFTSGLVVLGIPMLPRKKD